MEIGLLSTSMNVYSTKRIAEEAQNLGHYIELVDYTKCSVHLGPQKPQIYLLEENITKAFEAIIPRIGSKFTRHAAALVKQFEMQGVFSTASASGISRARNKVRTLQIMAKQGIPIPDTLFSIHPDNIEAQVNILGGPPVIIKLQEGTQGLGVMLAESMKSAKSIIDTFYRMETSILLQKYIEESMGEDLRIFVVDQKIVASMKRTSAVGEFRSNVHRGGSAKVITPTGKEQAMALGAAKHLGLGVAGVDLIRSKKGPLLIEVNASPGLQGIEATTGINIAKEIVLFVERKVRREAK